MSDKRIEGKIDAYAFQQSVIARLGLRALKCPHLFTFMTELVTEVAKAINVEFCKVLELLPDGDTLLLRAGIGWRKGLVGKARVSAKEHSQVGYTLLTDKPVVAEDINKEMRFKGYSLLIDHGVVSSISVIIGTPNHPIGVLGAHTPQKRAFREDEADFLQAAANILAAAIERKRAEECMKHMAYHDALTSLPNRYLFQDRLGMAILHAKRNNQMAALMALDLDDFKTVNDSLGHHMGDLLLKEAAARMKLCVRECDTVARLGGDEFMIILTSIRHRKDANHVAEKLLGALYQSFFIHNNKIIITASIGISIYPADGNDMEDLIRKADNALYYSKKEGKNTYRFYRTGL